MNSQKTGALIAARRSELGYTQKELAQRLSISDRTVSKWERGIGFPDISLLEPLADALGLTLLQLFHGEANTDPQPAAEAEHSVRETVRSLKTELSKSLHRLRRWLFFVASLLLCVTLALLVLLLHPDRGYFISQSEISSSQATHLSPNILISTQEFNLLAQLYVDPDIDPHLSDDHSAVLVLDSVISDRYQNRLQIDGKSVDDLTLSFYHTHLYVQYSLSTEDREILCILDTDFKGDITKTVAIFKNSRPYNLLINKNNTIFSIAEEERDLLFPFRSK